MPTHTLLSATIALSIIGSVAAQTAESSSLMESVSVLAFGPNNTLFAGDPRAGAVVALELGAASADATESVYFNVDSIDAKIAAALGVSLAQIAITDLAVHPVSKEVYIAVNRGLGDDMEVAIVVVQKDNSLTVLDVDQLAASKIVLSDVTDQDFDFWGKTPMRSFAITDMDFYDGALYVSGLSNEEFSSTVRKISYPFGSASDVTSISTEIYHATHNQNETRAPIRAMEILELNGEDYILASYTCTPLVLFPLSAIEDGAHVTGKTIAELGYGNTPLDLFSYSVTGFDGTQQDVVMVTHSEREANLFDLRDLAASLEVDGILTPTFDPIGVTSRTLPITGMTHTASLNANFIVGLKRNLMDGTLNLNSYPTSFYIKLDEFNVEYDFPSYAYPDDGSQDMVKGFHQFLIPMEGYDWDTRQPL